MALLASYALLVFAQSIVLVVVGTAGMGWAFHSFEDEFDVGWKNEAGSAVAGTGIGADA
jgi:hypothetical protein